METIKKISLLSLIALLMMMLWYTLDDKEKAKSYERNNFETLTIDSCEYIFKVVPYRGYLAHKGNCRFCKERRQKELEELAIKLKENNNYDRK